MLAWLPNFAIAQINGPGQTIGRHSAPFFAGQQLPYGLPKGLAAAAKAQSAIAQSSPTPAVSILQRLRMQPSSSSMSQARHVRRFSPLHDPHCDQPSRGLRPVLRRWQRGPSRVCAEQRWPFRSLRWPKRSCRNTIPYACQMCIRSWLLPEACERVGWLLRKSGARRPSIAFRRIRSGRRNGFATACSPAEISSEMAGRRVLR